MQALTLTLTAVPEGTAVFTVGVLFMLLWAALRTGNTPAMIMWGLTTLVVVFVQAFGVAVDLYWFAVLGTVVLLVVGFILQWVKV